MYARKGEGVVLETQQSSASGALTSRAGGTGLSVVAALAAIILADLAVVVAWTTWWHLSDFSGDGSLHSLFDHARDFLSWTFLPCWGVALAVLVLTWPLVRRRKPRNPSVVRSALTILAPVVWAVGFCGYYDQFDYLPMAMLVAVAAWIVTLQPLWAYLVLYRLRPDRP